MKPNLLSERGQALILIVLAAIGLFGIAGLAIDGSIKFSDRRQAQNAADAAALAAALGKGAGDDLASWKAKAKQIADDNGYDSNFLSNTVYVYSCLETASSCGAYAGNDQYVQVIIESKVDTYFARVLGFNQTKNTVQAVALSQTGGPFYDGNLIVALNPNPCTGSNGNIVLGGNSDINLTGGGLFLN